MKLNGGASWMRSIEATAVPFGFRTESSEFQPLVKRRLKGTGPFSDSKSLGEKSAKNLNANNIYDAECALLPADKDELILKWRIEFLDNWRSLHSCSDHSVREVLESFAHIFVERFGLLEHCRRYVQQVINLSWTWRNYSNGRSDRNVKIQYDDKVFEYQLGSSGQFYRLEDIFTNAKGAKQLAHFIEFAEKSFHGEVNDPKVNLEVAYNCGAGAEVYPSQLLPTEDEKRKQLFSIRDSHGREVVCIRKEKALNAIHTIDDWYCDDSDVEAVNVNPAGYDKGYAICCRSRGLGNDFFSILNVFEKHIKSLKVSGKPSNNHNYIMAMIIRGCLVTDEKNNR